MQRSSGLAAWLFGSWLAVAAIASLGAQGGAGSGEWRHYAGDNGATKYSPLDQITKDNVRTLRVAWRRPAVNPSVLTTRGWHQAQSELPFHAAHGPRRPLRLERCRPGRSDGSGDRPHALDAEAARGRYGQAAGNGQPRRRLLERGIASADLRDPRPASVRARRGVGRAARRISAIAAGWTSHPASDRCWRASRGTRRRSSSAT